MKNQTARLRLSLTLTLASPIEGEEMRTPGM